MVAINRQRNKASAILRRRELIRCESYLTSFCASKMNVNVAAENRSACSPGTQIDNTTGVIGKNPHKDRRGTQVLIVLLHHALIILIGFAQRLVVELGIGTTDSSEEVWRENQRIVSSYSKTREEAKWTHALWLVTATLIMCHEGRRRNSKEISCSLGCGKRGWSS